MVESQRTQYRRDHKTRGKSSPSLVSSYAIDDTKDWKEDDNTNPLIGSGMGSSVDGIAGNLRATDFDNDQFADISILLT